MRIDTPRDLAGVVRGRRISLGLSQANLAKRAGVSRPWLSHVETGKATAELGLIMRLLDALGLRLDVAESSGAPDHASAAAVDLDDVLEEYLRR